MNYKKLEGYENHIIFKTGKIFSLIRNRFLKPSDNGNGYLRVCLYKKGCKKQKRFLIHRLLGLLFIPNPENKPTVDHINRNKSDNRLINLRWATPKEQNNNQDIPKQNTSGTKGVSFYKDNRVKKWHTGLVVNGKKYNRNFKSKENAIACRRELEIKHLGEDYLV